jgi:acyl-coenzyme A synthetase/AMP-(fatty) acid ligase
MKIARMENYDETVRTFSWELPDTFNFGSDVVDRQAQDNDKPALIWCNDSGEELRFNFSDIRRLSNQMANLLVREGIRKGDRVVVMLPRIPEWQISMVACLKIGAIPIPCVEMLTTKDIAFRLKDSGAAGAITTFPNIDKFQAGDSLKARIAVDGAAGGWLSFTEAERESHEFECATMRIEDPALLFYTSGSSGYPKGVLHASRALFTWRLSGAYWHTFTDQDISWCTADTGWAKAGTGILFGPWSMGTTVLFYHGKFDPETRLRLLAHYRVNIFCAPATEFRHLVNAPVGAHDLRALRLCVSAGESVNPEVVKRWHALTGVRLLDGFGQTETLMTILNYPCMEVKPGSMGKPLPGCEFVVIDYDNEMVKDGEPGQLAMRLPNAQFMLGYWNDAKRTREAVAQIDGHDYWLTGDLGYRDADGYLFYTGRADDIISSAGYRIGPTEVESALIEHPAVVESAVVASPDEERGEVVKAFVVLRPAYQPSNELVDELQKHVQKTTAPYKYPRKIEFVDSLPKNPSGKLLRRVLRDMEFSKPAQPGAGET